jgi:hypothetical protein
MSVKTFLQISLAFFDRLSDDESVETENGLS